MILSDDQTFPVGTESFYNVENWLDGWFLGDNHFSPKIQSLVTPLKIIFFYESNDTKSR